MVRIGKLTLEAIQGSAIRAARFTALGERNHNFWWAFHMLMLGIGQESGKSRAVTSM